MLVDGHGLHVISEMQIDNRLLDVRVSTSALAGLADVRILLPANYAQEPERRYPVLYLMHGAFGGAPDWVSPGGAETTTAGLPLIVVMPDIGLNKDGGGSCTDWQTNPSSGPQDWETFHIDQLIPWVDQNLRTLGTREGRAIGGLSEGGYCAMVYAARHPDLFITALSFSGMEDIAYDKQGQILGGALTDEAAGTTGGTSDDVYGNPVTDDVNWENHDPATLAPNLSGMNLLMYNGNGLPGPYDPAVTAPGAPAFFALAGSLEASVAYDNQLFHNRLDSLGIASYWDDYGPGTHSWPYWIRDLQWSIGTIMSDFAKPPLTPTRITYTIADPSYTVYGWQVAMQRTDEEFSTLENAGASGFTLEGSGSGNIVTPQDFTPNATYEVVLRGDNFDHALALKADGEGRLHVEVPLGPPNAVQQDTSGAGIAGGTQTYTTDVEISRAG